MEKLLLRALTSSDMALTLNWNNQDDIKDLYAGHPFPVNLEMESDWYKKILHSNFPTTVFGMELIKETKLIGITILKNIDMIHRKAEFAIYIGDSSEKGKGYAKEATLKTIDFAFKKLGLNRIYLYVLKKNTTALKLYEKVGFQKEGILRNSIFKNGNFVDEMMMSILAKEMKTNEL